MQLYHIPYLLRCALNLAAGHLHTPPRSKLIIITVCSRQLSLLPLAVWKMSCSLKLQSYCGMSALPLAL